MLQSLRPFPQYSGIGQFQAPLGASWYDALQVKVIKRFSHGLTATMAYTFWKALDNSTNAGSIYDRRVSRDSRRTIFRTYSASAWTTRFRRLVWSSTIALPEVFLSGWKLSTISTWQSGNLLATPGSNNAIGELPFHRLYTAGSRAGCAAVFEETRIAAASIRRRRRF